VEEVTVDLISEAKAILRILRELAVDIRRALPDVVSTFEHVLGIPGVEAPSAAGAVAVRGIPVLVWPVMVARIPVRQQVGDEVVYVELSAQGIVRRQVVWIGGHRVCRRQHGIVVGRGAAANAAADDTAAAMFDCVVLVLVAAEHLGRPGVVGTLVDIVQAPVEAVDVDMDVGTVG